MCPPPDDLAAVVRLVPPRAPLRPPHTTAAGDGVARLVRSPGRDPDTTHGTGERRPDGMIRTDPSPSRILVIAGLLTVLAAVPRAVNLGRLSFYADEDLSALASHSVAQGEDGRLPSGFEYRRARPFTEVMALSERLFGQDEWVYRLPAAILGILSVPILFLFGRRLVGEGAAVVAALLLGLSDWHIGFSRQARMYTPLVFAVILGTWALWSWCRSGRWRELAAGLGVGVLAAFLHRGGMVLGSAVLVWLAFPGATAVPGLTILMVGLGVSILGYAISEYWTLVPYTQVVGAGAVPGVAPVDTVEMAAAPTGGGLALAGAALGIMLGIWLARRLLTGGSRPDAWRAFALGTLGTLTGAMAGSGQIYGAALAAALLLVADGRGLAATVRRTALPVAALGALLGAVAARGVLDAGLREGLERAADLPYPHLYTLLQQSPVFFGLFVAACVWSAVTPRRSDGLAACVLTSLGLLFAFGVLFDEVPTRYVIPIYPFIILTLAAVLDHLASRLLERVGVAPARRRLLAPAILAVVVASGILGGHGIPQAAHLVGLEHGEPMNRIAQMFPFRPDHRGPGLYVRETRGPGDLVIAEDPLMQAWYAGPIDYWFRRLGDMRQFLEVQEDGTVRDIYVGSIPLPDPARVDSLAGAAPGRVWFITSGETQSAADYYLTPEQRAWLDSLENARRPVAVGEDGVTSVYCLNCPAGTTPPSPPPPEATPPVPPPTR